MSTFATDASSSVTHSAGGTATADPDAMGVGATPEALSGPARNRIMTLSGSPGSPSQTMSPSFSACLSPTRSSSTQTPAGLRVSCSTAPSESSHRRAWMGLTPATSR